MKISYTVNLKAFIGAQSLRYGTLCIAVVVLCSLLATNQVHAQTSDEVSQTDSEVLRLEETIRANKEQPQVLTIVPWQLPTHQRIDETKAWQPVLSKLPSIERSQFLRDLAVVDEILSLSSPVSSAPKQPAESDNKANK